MFLAEIASIKSCKINFWVGFLWKIKLLGTTSRAKMAHPHLSINSLTPEIFTKVPCQDVGEVSLRSGNSGKIKIEK